jgi:membrane associated rhomboid family serine protease
VEQNIFTLLINVATVYYGGKYLERAWSSAEFAKFLLMVSVISNVIAFFIYVFWTAISGSSTASLVRSLLL